LRSRLRRIAWRGRTGTSTTGMIVPMHVMVSLFLSIGLLGLADASDSLAERLQAALAARAPEALAPLVEGAPEKVCGYALRSAPDLEWSVQPLRTPGGIEYLRVFAGIERERLHPVHEGRVGEPFPEFETFGYRVTDHDVTVNVTAPGGKVTVVCEGSLEYEKVPPGDPILRLHPGLKVTEARVAGTVVEVVRSGSYLALPKPIASRVRVRIAYETDPGTEPSLWVGDMSIGLLDRWVPRTGLEPIGYRLHADVPKGWAAVATGSLSSRTDSDSGNRFEFATEAPSGRVVFCAGPYLQVTKRQGDRTLSAWVFSGGQPVAESLLAAAAPVLARFDGWFGPLPWDQFHFVEAPQSATRAAAGNVIVWHRGVFERPSLRDVALAWWGSAVVDTGATGFWSESFANYSWALYRRRPSDDAPAVLDIMNSPRPAGRLLAGWEEFALTDCSDMTALRQATVARLKGPMVLSHLERVIGFDTMLKALRAFRSGVGDGGVATWTDFERAVSKVAEKEMKPFFDEWVRRPGLPDLVWADLKLLEGQGKVTITGTLEQSSPIYDLDIDLLAVGPRGRTWSGKLQVKADSTPVSIELPFYPSSIAFDPYLLIPRSYDPDGQPPTISSLDTFLRRPDTVVVVPRAMQERVGVLLAPFRDVTAVIAEDAKEEDLEGKNLVLLGSPDTNPVWDKRSAQSPLVFTAGFVSVGGQNFAADECFAAAVVETQDVKPRFIVFATELRLGSLGVDFAAAVVLDRSGKVVGGLPARFVKGDSVWRFHPSP